ncbi:PLP-dependent aminotransferase family protein [Brevibacillus ruminantium]|uniref:PLP-dependent aminotransferase family protein n=1 Tax=Brevibacillus ruminantium TaxID=2950604 RepID=A0ABY4WN21_9BACL|nr:PLP-dependent aminotransferase family protein [Brevibacillus ruminantium]USG68463.1 PLP-dependent aminotransferase family protein [Brevibacillus ruminantium]
MERVNGGGTQVKALSEHVYDYIWTRIQRGEWREHEKIPSIRLLASELNVHRLTVFKAYQRLKEDKKVYVKDKSGYYVHPGGLLPFDDLDSPIVSSYVQKSHLSEIHRVPATYQFSYALIDPNLLPNRYFSEYVKEIFDLYPKVLSTYSTVQGDEELRHVLARHFAHQHHFHVGADDILITSGSQQAIDLLARLLIQPMDAVLIERPTYSAAIDIFRQQGAKLLPVDIHPNGYDLEQVESYMIQHKPRLFYLNPTFHNPTGYTIPAKQRKQLVELAERHRCFLLEDDTFHDIYFDREPPLPLFSYSTEGYVVYIRSFSKYVAPGLRIAAVCLRPALMKHLFTLKALSDNGSPLLNQKIFLHYFSSARLQQHLEKLRIALNVRKSIMEEELSLTDWTWSSPAGGLNLWVKLPPSVPMDELLAKSIEKSISFVPGSICDPLKEKKAWMRLSYSYINEKQLREGVRQLIQLSRELNHAHTHF